MSISFLGKGGSSKYNATVILDLNKNATGLVDYAVGMLVEELPATIDLSHTNGYRYAFANFANLKKVPAITRNHNTTKASEANFMFVRCEKIETVPLFDTSNVRSAYNMFEDCKALKSVPAFDMSACTNTTNMFLDCTNLETVDITGFGNISTASNMFNGCKKLKHIPTLNVAKTTDLSNIFAGCESLEDDITLDVAACYNLSSAFQSCGKLTNNKITLTNTNKVSDWRQTFSGSTGNIADIPSMEAATQVASLFSANTNIERLPISSVGKATSVYCLCYNCSALTEFPAMDTSLVTTFERMVDGCASLVTVPTLNMAKATASASLSNVFRNCSSLSDESLNNILASLTTATGKTSNKTLMACGLTEEQAQKCTTLSNYEVFKAAGWTTGYDSIDNPATE